MCSQGEITQSKELTSTFFEIPKASWTIDQRGKKWGQCL